MLIPPDFITTLSNLKNKYKHYLSTLWTFHHLSLSASCLMYIQREFTVNSTLLFLVRRTCAFIVLRCRRDLPCFIHTAPFSSRSISRWLFPCRKSRVTSSARPGDGLRKTCNKSVVKRGPSRADTGNLRENNQQRRQQVINKSKLSLSQRK